MPGSGHSRGAVAGAWSQCRSFPCVHYNVLYSDPEVSQVLFRLSRWENLEHAEKI